MGILYPRRITIQRQATVAGATDAIGGVGYSGLVLSNVSSSAQAPITLFSKIPANIQASDTGRKKDSALPGDATVAPTWRIYIPKRSLKLGSVRDRDIVIDDLGARYQVGQDYWNILGYQLICIRLEA